MSLSAQGQRQFEKIDVVRVSFINISHLKTFEETLTKHILAFVICARLFPNQRESATYIILCGPADTHRYLSI